MVVNGHGGNYVLSNVVQQANASRRRMVLFPTREDWSNARHDAGMTSDSHDDMHAGELETSILLAIAPETVRENYLEQDHVASSRPYLLTVGVADYSDSGVIGLPSLASAQKGEAAITSLAKSISSALALLA